MSTEDKPHPFWSSEAFRKILVRARHRALRKQYIAPTQSNEESLRIINRLIDRIEKRTNHEQQNKENPAMDRWYYVPNRRSR